MTQAIVFDWDDTLLPSSYLEHNNITLGSVVDPDSKMWMKFQALDVLVFNLLTESLSLGRTIILTSAEHQWVIQTCKKFLPLSYAVVSEMEIYSARIQNTPSEKWKRIMVNKRLRGELNMFKGIVTIGDSSEERNAIKDYTSDHDMMFKSVYLRHDSKADDGIDSVAGFITYLTYAMPYIFNAENNIDIVLSSVYPSPFDYDG